MFHKGALDRFYRPGKPQRDAISGPASVLGVPAEACNAPSLMCLPPLPVPTRTAKELTESASPGAREACLSAGAGAGRPGPWRVRPPPSSQATACLASAVGTAISHLAAQDAPSGGPAL